MTEGTSISIKRSINVRAVVTPAWKEEAEKELSNAISSSLSSLLCVDVHHIISDDNFDFFILSVSLMINGESYNDDAVGINKSWKLIYSADEAEDGLITFEINYMDLAYVYML